MIANRTNFPSVSKLPLAAVAMVLVVAASPTHARPRPVSDYVSTQGTYCVQNRDDPACPPALPGAETLPDVLGWIGPAPDYHYVAVADFSGSYAAWVAQNGGPNLGTSVTGTINERALPDGRANVQVNLHTKHALVWVEDLAIVNIGPPVFGQWATKVVKGAPPSFVDCNFTLDFTNTAPGAPLPDLIELLFVFNPAREVHALTIRCTGVGDLAAGGKGQLVLSQTANFRTSFVGKGVADGFPAEVLKITPVRSGPKVVDMPSR